MSVASLRAYGLGEEILDEMAQTRISGLTFAPEAGTQRMRDVVNKNVTEEHIEESSRRVFSRGWNRLKLYFMVGLPTEEDDDVRGIISTGERMLKVGHKLVGSKAEVTVSVSSHVPKPHTPFQWAAQNPIAEIRRKQGILRATVRERSLRLKYHDSGISWVEGILSRGDRRLADVIEEVWKRGARFDGWDECFDVERWRTVLEDKGVDVDAYLGTRPVTARLPWDHLDVGLEDGFLLQEYRKALKSRLSPPCGKVAGMLVHHTNLRDAEPDARMLVCYDCGVACDLSKMRDDRLVALRTLGADEPRVRSGPEDDVRSERVRKRGFNDAVETPWATYRIRFTKLGRAAFLGHLDLVRLLGRSFRRAEVPLAVTRGYTPHPRLTFGPALGLGVPALAELLDADIEHGPDGAWTGDAIADRLRTVVPEGISILGCDLVPAGDRGLGRRIRAFDLLLQPAEPLDEAALGAVAAGFLARTEAPVARKDRMIDVRGLVAEVELLGPGVASRLCAALDWEYRPMLRARISSTAEGSAKPIEVAKALGIWGDDDPRGVHARLARLGLVETD
jgi:radical SAM-linked protein